MSGDVIRTKSLGTSSEGVRDQYADGKAAKVWELFIGDQKSRTENYKNFLIGLLRKKGCRRVLDVACGTGVDSILLLEEGFEVVSCDASDKMLKYALKERWARRKEPAFDTWIIEEANWVSLYDDIGHLVGDGFDAVICLGNSFAHMLDTFGDQREQKQAMKNFERCVKPGGLLLIDHRNYDNIINCGGVPSKNFYYNSTYHTDIKTYVMYSELEPTMIIMDYVLDTGSLKNGTQITNGTGAETKNEFRLSYYPIRLAPFKKLLQDTFNIQGEHEIYGDFQPITPESVPHFYIHVVDKK